MIAQSVSRWVTLQVTLSWDQVIMVFLSFIPDFIFTCFFGFPLQGRTIHFSLVCTLELAPKSRKVTKEANDLAQVDCGDRQLSRTKIIGSQKCGAFWITLQHPKSRDFVVWLPRRLCKFDGRDAKPQRRQFHGIQSRNFEVNSNVGKRFDEIYPQLEGKDHGMGALRLDRGTMREAQSSVTHFVTKNRKRLNLFRRANSSTLRIDFCEELTGFSCRHRAVKRSACLLLFATFSFRQRKSWPFPITFCEA